QTPSRTADVTPMARSSTAMAAARSVAGAAAASVRRTVPSASEAMSRRPGQSGAKSHSTLSISTRSSEGCWGRIGASMPPAYPGRSPAQGHVRDARQEGSGRGRSARTVEVQVPLLDLGADLGLDRLPGVEVPLADEGDGGAL